MIELNKIDVLGYARSNGLSGHSAIVDKEFREFFVDKDINCIVEIGTYLGISAAHMAQFAKEVHTFDIIDYPEREKVWQDLKLTNVYFHLIKPREGSRNFQNRMPDDPNAKDIGEVLKAIDFDFAFIDATHHNYTEVKLDFELVKGCGRVFFHDADPKGFPKVSQLVDEIGAKRIGGLAYWQR